MRASLASRSGSLDSFQVRVRWKVTSWPCSTWRSRSWQARAGDSCIDPEAIWLTAYQAGRRPSAGLPAEREIAIASYWASEGGFRVVHAAVHVHGGVGGDRDYPLHRHFLAARHMELALGHAEGARPTWDASSPPPRRRPSRN
ncbi:MAG: acyl-CoA dehydrogenase [Acidimicrobiaceae bacterium]|nr:acyl-CoA dehydrogenase [Acidimicrobiaceae bacterium]MXZ98400.1 acyl-CoA dehydrogenase [Acidimicrobiaceae bacterium]MYE76003.1 acyl-CoA dehydrogenase [Acidimicrobiaceae bacterium]MYE98422.1 acyl-CoA dehydrogenase [Acidimicrobiaceae bacterium]MYH44768.1 acyl-CoA dehydrogenase [Acidimicrobiaceae bacterium]